MRHWQTLIKLSSFKLQVQGSPHKSVKQRGPVIGPCYPAPIPKREVTAVALTRWVLAPLAILRRTPYYRGASSFSHFYILSSQFVRSHDSYDHL